MAFGAAAVAAAKEWREDGVQFTRRYAEPGVLHQHLQFAAAELVHHGVLLRAFHLAVEETNGEPLEFIRRQPRSFGDGAGRLHSLRLLHQGTYNEGPSAGRYFGSHGGPSLAVVGTWEPTRRDGLATRRQFVKLGSVQVAKDHHRGRAGNRRGRHHQQVGVAPLAGVLTALVTQNRTLFYAESVLLVNNDEAE